MRQVQNRVTPVITDKKIAPSYNQPTKPPQDDSPRDNSPSWEKKG